MSIVSRLRGNVNGTTETTVYFDGLAWRVLRKTSTVNRVGDERFGNPMDAIDRAIEQARLYGVRCNVESWLYDGYTAQQRMAGIDLYRNGLGAGLCQNRWQADGYTAALNDDDQPLPMRGWQLAEAAPA